MTRSNILVAAVVGFGILAASSVPASACDKCTDKGTCQAMSGKVDPRLVGIWKAAPAQNVVVNIAVNPDATFGWAVNANGQTSTFGGKFTLTGNVITFINAAGGQPTVGKFMLTQQGDLRLIFESAAGKGMQIVFAR